MNCETREEDVLQTWGEEEREEVMERRKEATASTSRPHRTSATPELLRR